MRASGPLRGTDSRRSPDRFSLALDECSKRREFCGNEAARDENESRCRARAVTCALRAQCGVARVLQRAFQDNTVADCSSYVQSA